MFKRMVVVALGVCLVGAVGCSELKDLRKQNVSLRDQLSQCESDRDSLGLQVDALKANRADLQKGLGDATQESERMAKLVSELRGEQARLDKQRQQLQSLVKDLSGISVESRPEGNFLVLESDVLFASGKADLTAESAVSLDKVADYLLANPSQSIRIDGHTDAVPIKYSGWKNNYHLGAMRALAVMEYLSTKGVEAKRMYIVGFGPNKPRVQPDEPELPMEQNRRVEILVVPEGSRSISDILKGFQQ